MASELAAALQQLEKLKSECQEAKNETLTMRQKLHNAIRKGKALEADKQQKSDEAQTLRQELERIRVSPATARDPQGSSADPDVVRRLQQEQTALQTRVDQLLAQEASYETERQEAARHAAEQNRELESRLHHAQYLEEVSKTKQRELAAQQGECLLLRAALESAQEQVLEARATQQPAVSQAETDGERVCSELVGMFPFSLELVCC